MTDEERKARNRAASARYRERHPGYSAEKTRRYREANPEKAAETARICAKRYYYEHRDDPGYKERAAAVVGDWARQKYENAGWATYKAAHCRNRNKKLGLEPTDVTKEFILESFKNQGGKCYYTAVPFRMETGSIFAPSVDRKDPSQGYFRSNVVLCLAGINYAKHDSSLDEFAEFLSAVSGSDISDFFRSRS